MAATKADIATPGAYSAASTIDGRIVSESSADTRCPYCRQAARASYRGQPDSDTDGRLIFYGKSGRPRSSEIRQVRWGLERLVAGELARPEACQAVSLQPHVLHCVHHVATRAIDAADRHVRFQTVPRIEGEALAEFLLRRGGKGLRIDIDGGDLLPGRGLIAPGDECVFDRFRDRIAAHLDLQVQPEMAAARRIEQIFQTLLQIIRRFAGLGVLRLLLGWKRAVFYDMGVVAENEWRHAEPFDIGDARVNLAAGQQIIGPAWMGEKMPRHVRVVHRIAGAAAL